MKDIKIIYEEKTLFNIPLIEAYLENTDPEGLCFINHGFSSEKGDGTYFMMFELAKLGLKVVAIDAYKHGQRLEEPMISGTMDEKIDGMYDYVIQTGQDIKYLYDNHYNKSFDQVMITGISMGGAVTYYAGSIMKEAKNLVTMIGFPSFYQFELDSKQYDEESLALKSKDLQVLKDADPIFNIDKYEDKNILILNGVSDDVVPIKYARTFYDLVDSTCNCNMIEFECNHEVPIEMRQAVYNFVKNMDKSKSFK